jgi:hypothetical protein
MSFELDSADDEGFAAAQQSVVKAGPVEPVGKTDPNERPTTDLTEGAPMKPDTATNTPENVVEDQPNDDDDDDDEYNEDDEQKKKKKTDSWKTDIPRVSTNNKALKLKQGTAPRKVHMNGKTPGGKVMLFALKLVVGNFFETLEEFDTDENNRKMVRVYANSLEFATAKDQTNARCMATTNGIVQALRLAPSLREGERLLQNCDTKEDVDFVIREAVLKIYPSGLKAEQICNMDFTLANATRIVHAHFFSRAHYSRYLKRLLDKDYKAENMTEEAIERRNAMRRKNYYQRQLKLAQQAATLCSQLPTEVGILISKSYRVPLLMFPIAFYDCILTTILSSGPPEGWLEEYRCAGDYIKHCIENKKKPPIILHGCPLPEAKMWKLENDVRATLYPGDQLPYSVLDLIKNTRKGKEWSKFLWANIFATVVIKFLENHKGGVIRNRKPFCMLALHPNNPAYHLFHQDYFIDDNGTTYLPYHRETYLKSAWKCTFDAILCFNPRANDDGWDVNRAYDPNDLFKDDDLNELVARFKNSNI